MAAARTYKVSNRHKKTVVETELWHKRGLAGDLRVETGWRGGVWYVTPEGDEPVPVDGQEGINFDEEYANYELDHTWDGCWTEIDIECEVPEAERERIYEGFQDEGTEFLEAEGWEPQGCTTVIHGEIDVEAIAEQEAPGRDSTASKAGGGDSEESVEET